MMCLLYLVLYIATILAYSYSIIVLAMNDNIVPLLTMTGILLGLAVLLGGGLVVLTSIILIPLALALSVILILV